MPDFGDVESVIENSLKFTEKLKIDEDTFSASSIKENLKIHLINIPELAEKIADDFEEDWTDSGEMLTAETAEQYSTDIGVEIGAYLVRAIEDKLETSDNPLISRWTSCKRGRSGFTGRSGSDAAGFGPDFRIPNARCGPVPASSARFGPHADTKPLGGGLA